MNLQKFVCYAEHEQKSYIQYTLTGDGSQSVDGLGDVGLRFRVSFAVSATVYVLHWTGLSPYLS